MTTTMETNQAQDGGDLAAILQRLFGQASDAEEYEYLRIPGLHLPSELEDVIEPGHDYVVWQAGELHNGRMLLAVYCRREKAASGEEPTGVEVPSPTPPPAPVQVPTASSVKPAIRKRSR